ncbi:efflux RND transporter periplasmic adaptor subunit [Stieleria varia]|uniref:Efflux pump periplasmic linker BepF n=1 Tax=Stieleria varia TaxID=2528005 RepID=A0A5C6AST5_9BACT|nr:efflux RND transporter periplasmic adaptor subunit [Stieleria varia]TWU02598.1 Efflux pump periplasmic linker BepF [Stieleria varia]
MKCLIPVLAIVALVGCTPERSPDTDTPPPPPGVLVEPATARDIIDFREFTGRTAAVDSVELRARVSGYLRQTPRTKGNVESELQVKVDEGMLVKENDLLFVIDRKPYQLALQQSQGALDAAKAKLKQANKDLSRSEQLLDRNATSRAEYDQSIAAVADLQGQIETLKATVARNELDLDYTQVRSPIDGLLGRTLVTVGNLVSADSTILSTVVSINPIYVDFDVDEQSVLDYRTRMLDGKVDNARKTKIKAWLGLGNESGFPHEGVIDFVNNVTDPNTGNTRVRATFENETGILSPGLFARVRVPFTAKYKATLVPSNSIAMDQQGRHVMVVRDDNEVSRRSVTLGPIRDDMTVVRDGIQAGERVVISGLQKIRPGIKVRVENEPSGSTKNSDSSEDVGDGA